MAKGAITKTNVSVVFLTFAVISCVYVFWFQQEWVTVNYLNFFNFSKSCVLVNDFRNDAISVSLTNDIEEQKNIFDKQVDRRRSLISNEKTLPSLQMFVVPQISCPTAVRVGSIGDGGKWVCNPWRAPSSCIVYSFGVNGDTSFEFEMYNITKNRCTIYSFDINAQDQRLFENFKGVFKQWKISGTTNKTSSEWSVIDIAEYFSHDKIDFIKMDIEGSEFSSLPVLLNSTFSKGKICQIFIELHEDVNKWRSLQNQIEKTGFLMFYKEANSYCPNCYEYSYIHSDCLSQYGVTNFVFNSNFS